MDSPVMDLIHMVGDYGAGDGFFYLVYGEFADHTQGEGCTVQADFAYADEVLDDEHDPEPWSAHFHVGLMAEGPDYPEHWDHGDCFCARGSTMEEAIARAYLLANGEPL